MHTLKANIEIAVRLVSTGRRAAPSNESVDMMKECQDLQYDIVRRTNSMLKTGVDTNDKT